MKFTIMGGTGFVGSNLANYLTEQGYEVAIAPRDVKQLEGQELGHVVYAIGLTGDFRTRPHDTIEAHVSLLSWVLQNCKFESFLYCSSTRVYGGLPSNQLANEDNKLSIIPSSDSLYDLSKLLGESLCLSMNDPKIKVARLSNVYGEGQSKQTFLGAVIDEIRRDGSVVINDNEQSTKDYISIDDVSLLITKIILQGSHLIYNVASGKVVKCADIAGWIKQLGYEVSFSGKGSVRNFPPIDIARLVEEFDFKPRDLAEDIRILITKDKN